MKKIFITILLFSFAGSTLQAAGLPKTPDSEPTTGGTDQPGTTDGGDPSDPTGGTDQPGTTEEDPNIAIVNALLAQAAGELEPNNHITAANPITPNTPVTGQLYSADDTDWFYIQTTAKNEVLTIEMPSQSSAWTVSIRDHAGNLFARRDSLTDRELTFSTTLLSPEVYYIVIENFDDNRNPYVFTARATNYVDPSDPASDTNFFDVELEPNNAFSDANIVSSAVTTVGQLIHGGDFDVYRIDSDGNEILSVDLCPQNSGCAGQNAWVLMVFDGAEVNDGTLAQTVQLDVRTVDSDLFVSVASNSSHPYLLFASGLLNPIGIIDPTFGGSTRVSIGIKDPGTYYAMVTPVLKRDENGSVVLEETLKLKVTVGQGEDAKEEGTIRQWILNEPFSDDQYTFHVTRTELNPTSANTLAGQLRAARSSVTGDKLHIPVVDVNGSLFSGDLQIFTQDGKIMFELIDAQPLN